MSGSVAVFCLYPDDLTPVTREGEEKPHKQVMIFSFFLIRNLKSLLRP